MIIFLFFTDEETEAQNGIAGMGHSSVSHPDCLVQGLHSTCANSELC